ncbi:hypothetical protein UFOVP650_4 [uncultured Caudovirales phage]|uniref:Uncharacterized protein n=1 Tax=uncultured Caudovirales phage TaxID=2100421 RepID=A0A6J5NAF3_9CAUD|nr:hypothetical protein UFOVP650_4 [uncultured Caudovirales phage]
MAKPTAEGTAWELELPQPWASCVVLGKLEVANLFAPPAAELIGRRVTIVAGPVCKDLLWLIPMATGAPLPEAKKGWPRGAVGSAVLQGWLRTGRQGAIVEQVRPGDSTPFRRPKGLSGPYGWVLRLPSIKIQPRGIATTIRAGYWDLPAVQRHLLHYVDQHGEQGLNPEQAEQLRRLRERQEQYGRFEDTSGAAGIDPG